MNHTSRTFLLATALVACGGPSASTSQPTPAALAPCPSATPSAAVAMPGPPPAVAWADTASPFPVTSNDPMQGDRDALVTIIEFADYQCPFSSRVQPTLAQLRQLYAPNQLRILWRNNPLVFHQNAKPAAEAAQGVFVLGGPNAFWKFHELAFTNQRELNEDNYVKWAGLSGVGDLAAFRDGLTNHTWISKVEADQASAKAAGANGTPGFRINGVFLNGAQPIEKFQAVIDTELAKAQTKIASGTPRDQIYVVMSTENKANEPPPPPLLHHRDNSATVYKIPVGSSPVRGAPTALVTLVVFSDFQCPYCQRIEPTLKNLSTKYGDKVRFVWKNFPLAMHKNAEPAAQLAAEARAEKGDTGFWAAHDALFEKQDDLSETSLLGVAKDLGLNVPKVKLAIESHKYKEALLDADIALGEGFGVEGTPSIFVNGRRGEASEAQLIALIDEELPKAEALVKAGTKPSEIYQQVIMDGKGPAEPEKRALVNLPAHEPSRGGDAHAKVVIDQFSDFQCPYCSRAEATIKQVIKDYGGKVRFVWHDMPLPFHPYASLAAEAAREAYAQKGTAGFWKMHDTLFENQHELAREDLDKYAAAQGLDMAKWKVALDTNSHKAEVGASGKPGTDAGINGVPGFVINGYYLSGAQPYEKFQKLIDRALSEAK